MADVPRGRVDRFCDACRIIDNHPRHIHFGDDGGVVYKHMDCCDQAGCPDGSCTAVMAASGRAKGEALIAHLAGGA